MSGLEADVITSKIEHHAILQICEYLEKQGYEITYLDVDEEGKISLVELRTAIRLDTILISVMAANNEIGTIIDVILFFAEICRKMKDCYRKPEVKLNSG